MESDDREPRKERSRERRGDIETEIKRQGEMGPRGTGTGTQYVRGGASRRTVGWDRVGCRIGRWL